MGIVTELDEISKICAEYYRTDGRRFPWRETNDPYLVLLAEFLLRKTQVSKVLPIFLKLTEAYPSFEALAGADLKEVRSIVAPLGLPSRGKQLTDIARALSMSQERTDSGQELKKFKGVGTYIANAIDCLAFERPAPMVDGAVGRLLHRFFGSCSDKPAYADKSLFALAQGILESSSESCKSVSLGLLDIAAKYCKLNTPLCLECPLGKLCKYRQSPLIYTHHSRSSTRRTTQYWIFVLTPYTDFNIGSFEESIDKIKSSKRWPIGKRTPHRLKLLAGDDVLVYEAGPEGRQIRGSARLRSKLIENKSFDYVELSEIRLWEKPIKMKDVARRMEFAEGNDRWWIYLQGGIARISANDYKRIVRKGQSHNCNERQKSCFKFTHSKVF